MQVRFACQDAVEKALADNGVNNPAEVLCALLIVLRHQHVGLRALGYRDGLDRLTGEHAATLAESLCNLLRVNVAANAGQVEAHRHAGREADALRTGTLASRAKVLADVLDYLLPAWNFEHTEAQEAAAHAGGFAAQGPGS